MSKKKRPSVALIGILVLLVGVGAFFGVRALLAKADSGLSASGTIEVVQITISPQLSGRVVEVMVDEGDDVMAGEVLFKMDDSTHLAQRNVTLSTLDLANDALATAQINYNLVLDAAHAETSSLRHTTWRSANPADYSLPDWYFTQAEEIRAADVALEAARMLRDSEQSNLDGLLSRPGYADFIGAETRLANARASFLVAQDVLTRSGLADDNPDLLAAAEEAYDAAGSELQDAQEAYDLLAETDTGKVVLQERSRLAVAQAGYEAARDRRFALQTGEFSPKAITARSAVEQAVDAVGQAQANLALIDTQLSMLIVRSPADGLILSSNIQAGEVAAAGSNMMTLGLLDNLTITVYVPEDRYGELSIGQEAEVNVDSVPGEVFTASIFYISDQAEFTPRNVQTAEGRSSTVFAIQLRLVNPDDRLKPGMPADVIFVETGQ